MLGHPYHSTKPVEEGKHYTVLAYTDWADTFVPTVVKWNHGEVDDLTSPEKSLLNRSRAIRHAKSSGMGHSIQLPGEKKERAESGSVKKPIRVRKMFERLGVPYYGIWNQEKQKWLHEDGSWTDPYPEKGLMWYAIKPEIAKQKLKEIKPSDMSRSIKLPVGGGTLKVRGKEYVWRTGDRSYEAAQEKAEDLRSRGHKAVIRKEQVAGKPTYVVYARKEDAR